MFFHCYNHDTISKHILDRNIQCVSKHTFNRESWSLLKVKLHIEGQLISFIKDASLCRLGNNFFMCQVHNYIQFVNKFDQFEAVIQQTKNK